MEIITLHIAFLCVKDVTNLSIPLRIHPTSLCTNYVHTTGRNLSEQTGLSCVPKPFVIGGEGGAEGSSWLVHIACACAWGQQKKLGGGGGGGGKKKK